MVSADPQLTDTSLLRGGGKESDKGEWPAVMMASVVGVGVRQREQRV